MRFIGFVTFLTITGCLEPQGQVASEGQSDAYGPRSFKEQISLIDMPENEIESKTLIYLDSNNVLSIMQKDGSYRSLDGNTLSAVKTAGGLAENSTNYIAADGAALKLEDQMIKVTTGGSSSAEEVPVNIDMSNATVKRFSSDEFVVEVSGYIYSIFNKG